MTAPRSKLELDPAVVRKARSLARKAGAPVVKLAKTQVGHIHTLVLTDCCLGPCIVNLLTGHPANFRN